MPKFQYGAPIGSHARHAQDKSIPFKFSVQRERLNQGGYSESGCYFGVGEPLYLVIAEPRSAEHAYKGIEGIHDHDPHFHIRAADRDAAKKAVTALYPNARFYR